MVKDETKSNIYGIVVAIVGIILIVGTGFVVINIMKEQISNSANSTYTININNQDIVCKKGYHERCGYTLLNCSDSNTYSCATNVKIYPLLDAI